MEKNKVIKMVTYDKVVYTCLICKRSFLGDITTNIDTCPSCKHAGNVVLDGRYIVRK